MTSWAELTALTQGAPIRVSRVQLKHRDIAIEGDFEPPPLAALPAEDQVFITAFVRAHGSIKEMERLFGISYPTVKNRLNRIGARLPLLQEAPPSDQAAVLEQLERGEISAAEAIEALRR